MGYSLADGTRVMALAFADDIALVARSREELQALLSSLCEFLEYHGVTLSADADPLVSKTIYVSNRPSGPLLATVFDRSSRPGSIRPRTRVQVKCGGSQTIFRYLGGFLSLDLNWSKLWPRSKRSIDFELDKLSRSRISLPELLLSIQYSILGKAGFFLQLCQFPLTALEQWDSRLSALVRSKAGLCYSSSSAPFLAPRSRGGLGVPSFVSLATQAAGTELLVRLNSPGLMGEVGPSLRCHGGPSRLP